MKPEFISGRRVATSPIAEHLDTKLKFSFHPRPDERYYLWYKAGAGGSHELHVSDAQISSVVYDNETHGMLNAYRFLYEGGCFFGAEDRRPTTFSLELVGTVVRSLLAQIRRGEEPDTILSNFVAAHKLQVVDEASLLALEELTDYSQLLFNTTASEQQDEVEDVGDRSFLDYYAEDAADDGIDSESDYD
jgi:hypothetical protein